MAALSSALHKTVEQVASRAVECLSAAAAAAATTPSRSAEMARESREEAPSSARPAIANAEP